MPTILNSDQGSQFTCKAYIDYLKSNGIQISMDRKGRALGNIFIERFWRTIKYQYIYLNPSVSGVDLFIGIKSGLRDIISGHTKEYKKKPIDIYKMVA